MKSDDAYGEPQDALEVRAIVQAVNTFPRFVEHGITWANRDWDELEEFEGLMIDLEGHDPERVGPGRFDDEAGSCDSVKIYISYGTDSDLIACLELAIRIAEATGATCWDLQTDKAVDRASSGSALGEWDRIRARFSWLLRPRRGFWSAVRAWLSGRGDHRSH
ncbi:MAG: hypothetical protein L6Q38_06190 [Nitrospira sp.]|nr:hypothetical protein [Nitrospira sp.]